MSASPFQRPADIPRPPDVDPGQTPPAGFIERWRWRRKAKMAMPAAVAGDPNVQFVVGYRLERAGDLKDAKEWYTRSANQGHGKAIVNLGQMHCNAGRLAESLPFFEKAGEMGIAVGARNAANVANVLGDFEKAHRWRVRAAEMGDEWSKRMLEEGIDHPRT